MESYLWDDDVTVAEWVDRQLEGVLGAASGALSGGMSPDGCSTYLLENIHMLKRDQAIAQVKEVVKEFPEIAMDTIVHLMRHMTPGARAETLNTLNKMDLISQRGTPEEEQPSTPVDALPDPPRGGS